MFHHLQSFVFNQLFQPIRNIYVIIFIKVTDVSCLAHRFPPVNSTQKQQMLDASPDQCIMTK